MLINIRPVLPMSDWTSGRNPVWNIPHPDRVGWGWSYFGSDTTRKQYQRYFGSRGFVAESRSDRCAGTGAAGS